MKVIYKGDLKGASTADVTVDINGEIFDSERMVVPAIVRIVAQEGEKSTFTQYKFDIEFADDYDNVTDLVLTYDNSSIDGNIGTIKDGELKSITNSDKSSNLMVMEYSVNGTPVSIDRNSYKDFFEIA